MRDAMKAKSETKFKSILSLLATLMIATACGGTDRGDQDQSTSGQGGGGGGGTNTETEIPFDADLSYEWETTGSTGEDSIWESPLLPGVDTLLKVRVTASSNGYVTAPGYEQYAINPGIMTLRVGVKDGLDEGAVPVSKTTDFLRTVNGDDWVADLYFSMNGGDPNSVKDAWVHDFSNAITGPGPFKLQVWQARYDYYCQLLFLGYPVGSMASNCLVRNVYTTHGMSGDIEVQTNLD